MYSRLQFLTLTGLASFRPIISSGLFFKDFIWNYKFDEHKFRNNIIKEPTFNTDLYGEVPGGVTEFKNLVG